MVVLAAGGSVRLGRPKQLLTRDGETLVHRAARLALETAPRRLFVVVGAGHDAIGQAIRDIPCELIHNPAWEEGLGSSLRAAASRLQGEGSPVLVLACDQPALERQHLSALLDGARTAASRCAATWHGDVPGVPAVVPGAWFEDASSLSGDRGFGRRLREQPDGSVFDLRATELEFDIDTQDDVERAVRLGWLDREGRPAVAPGG